MTAYIATGITVAFSTLSGEIVDVDAAGDAAEPVDSTHQTSTEYWRTHEATNCLKQAGPITILAHWGGTIPAVGTSATITVTLPNGKSDTGTAILQNAGGYSGKLGQKMTCEMTFLRSGKPTRT